MDDPGEMVGLGYEQTASKRGSNLLHQHFPVSHLKGCGDFCVFWVDEHPHTYRPIIYATISYQLLSHTAQVA